MNKIWQRFYIKNQNSIYFYSVVVGVLSGLATAVFSYVLHASEEWVFSVHGYTFTENLSLFQKIESISTSWLGSLLIVLFPAIGGLISGLIIFYFCREASGTGADEMIYAFHHKEGNIDSKVPLYKSIATIFTLASGGSGGKEGPIAQIGGGIGVFVARIVKAGARARRTLLLAGTAAGLGAVFKAPLGGALTAVEMVYKEDIESDALIPCFISSVTAYLVYTAYAGTSSFMPVGEITFLHFNELFFYLLLGVLCFLFGYLFIKGFKDTRKFINKIKIHRIIKPAIGGLLVGCISLLFIEVAGTGSGYLQKTFSGNVPELFGPGLIRFALGFLLIAFLKIVATTLTIGSGGSAGIFGPSLFIGGMLGAAVGTFAKWFMPGEVITIGSFIVVGMGAFYAGVANAPIAGIIMICEITGSYILLPPLILVSIFTFILSNKISFYKNQVDNRFKSPAHYWDMKLDIIEKLKISTNFKEFRTFAVIQKDTLFTQVKKLASEIEASDFVVVNPDNSYAGMIKLRSIDFSNEQLFFPEQTVEPFLVNVPYVIPQQNLEKALNIVMEHDVDKVAVVKENQVLGYIRTRDIFHAYNQAVNKKESI